MCCWRSPMARPRLDLKGQRFGTVVVQYESRTADGGHIMWMCLCDCGDQLEVRGSNLKYKGAQMCAACAKEDIAARRPDRYITWRGETRTAAAWAEIVGITAPVIQKRLLRGWSVDRAMTEPQRLYGDRR